MEAFESGRYHEATEAFSMIAFFLLVTSEAVDSPDDAMTMTIESYKKIDKESIVDQILEENAGDLPEQYFEVVRHYLDYWKETEEREVQEKMHRKLPLGVPEEREYPFEEGKVTSDHKIIPPYEVFVVSAQGPRDEMEDTHLMTEVDMNIQGDHKLQLFGVFDGHGGAKCALYVQRYLPEIIQLELQNNTSLSDLDIYNALARAFVRLDKDWKGLPFQQTSSRDSSGTTATVGIIIDQEKLWVANVGDSRAVIGDDGQAIQLSEEAKPTIQKYSNEILFRGGSVAWGRVDGSLDMARSIGDLNHPSVSARPTIKQYDLKTFSKNDENVIILACDGLWDVVDPETAIDVARGKSAQHAAIALKTIAYQKGSWDNVTIMVIKPSGY